MKPLVAVDSCTQETAEIQQEVLHDTTAGSMPHPLHIFGASPTGIFSVLSCSSVRQQMQASCKFQT
jgi:hypothetical protein